MFEAITAYGISGRAAKRDIVQVTCINPRDFAEGNYRRVDERPFGGGPGMVMMAELFGESNCTCQTACLTSRTCSCSCGVYVPTRQNLK